MDKVEKEQTKGQLMSDSPSDSCFLSNGLMNKSRNTSFFSVAGLFVGFSTKGLSDSDAVRSPTSPLDYKGFCNQGSSFLGSPRSGSLDCSRVGLSLVDALNDETKTPWKFLASPESKNILFGPQVRINISSPKSHLGGLRHDSSLAAPKSLPKDYGISSHTHCGGSSSMSFRPKGTESESGEFGLPRSCSADVSRSSLQLTKSMYHNSKSNSELFPSDSKNSILDSYQLVEGSANFEKFSGSLPVSISSAYGVIASLSASEIEQSENYTRIISHGPNPKTTHIFGDCIIESHSFSSPDLENKDRKEWDSPHFSSTDFLSFCYYCKKKLEEGKDIYMYRGEKAFCSCDCRDQQIFIEEEMDKTRNYFI